MHHALVMASSTSVVYWLVTQVRALKAETETPPHPHKQEPAEKVTYRG